MASPTEVPTDAQSHSSTIAPSTGAERSLSISAVILHLLRYTFGGTEGLKGGENPDWSKVNTATNCERGLRLSWRPPAKSRRSFYPADPQFLDGDEKKPFHSKAFSYPATLDALNFPN
jgi:hypothetical protein